MNSGRVRSLVSLLVLLLAVSGCARTLMPTPTLYLVTGEDPFDEVPVVRRSNIVELLYATDRAPTHDDPADIRYGAGRSLSLAFGTAQVQIGPDDLTWEELVAASRSERRDASLRVRFIGAQERVRTPIWPWQQNLVDDPSLTREAVELMEAEAEQTFHVLLSEKLDQTPDKRVFVFIHGFNNTHPYAVESAAELWHMGGRKGVFIVYSWPAARDGLFGYNADIESGEFTIWHLKQFLRMLGRCEDVEGIGVLAHSRGTDVLMNALRELHIQYTAQGQDTAEVLKLDSVILMAADIDLEVSTQRLGAERVVEATKHMTIYTASDDRALQMAAKIFGSKKRLGEVGPDAITDAGRIMLKQSGGRLTIIYRPYRIGFLGHAYFLDDPAVGSDLILAGQHNRPPGAEHGRPLILDPSGIWIMPKNYPRNMPEPTPE